MRAFLSFRNRLRRYVLWIVQDELQKQSARAREEIVNLIKNGEVDRANLSERIRACGHLSQASAQTKCNPARKFRAVFSYRVAIARKCLIMQKNRSTRLRSQ